MTQAIAVADWSDADDVFECCAAGAAPLTVENTF